jgi:bifunctional autolysin
MVSQNMFLKNSHFLYGTVNNRTGWIAAKDLEQANSNNPATPYNYTLDYLSLLVLNL